jgi:monooxygenase
MERKGYQVCVPRNDDPSVREEPWLNLTSGYLLRAADKLPKQGSKRPWRLRQNCVLDMLALRTARMDDGVMRFYRGG